MLVVELSFARRKATFPAAVWLPSIKIPPPDVEVDCTNTFPPLALIKRIPSAVCEEPPAIRMA